MLPIACLIREGIPLAAHTFWKIGGPAARLAEPRTEAELLFCLSLAREEGWPLLALGGGSNVLISDQGFPGLVVIYGDESESTARKGDRLRLRLGSGALLAPAARRWARQGWAGLEWAEGIPGTIGGAIAGNAGAYGGDIASTLRSVEVLADSARFESWTVADCRFAYRRSAFRDLAPEQAFVSAATFLLRADDTAALTARMSRIGAERKSKTPGGLSCGSVFKNPEGGSAGRLIEEAGLKGASEGAAQVSEVHANYIVNRGGAHAADVVRLIERIRARVREHSGILLEPEVRLIGPMPALDPAP